MAKVVAVCTSRKKGTSKTPVDEGVFDREYGLRGDAHADCATHRQVSLLALESIQKMKHLGLDIGPGAFAENITTEGIDLCTLPVGTHLSTGDDVVLEVSQIGKECHTRCAIYRKVGQCIMPEEGVFARVLQGGVIRTGDMLRIIDNYEIPSQSSNSDLGM
ncbi:MOSC domain-containing protein [Chloroflexota bacterium]